MLLGQTAPAPSQTSFSNPKQIVAVGSSGSVVMYTVPAGKKFQGTVASNATGHIVAITPSGGALTWVLVPSLSSSPTAPALPITLVAGSIFTNISGANSSYLIGVETDA